MSGQTKLQRLLALWPVLVALAGGASVTYTWVKTQHSSHLGSVIAAHDRELEKDAHPTLQIRLKALEDHWNAHTRDYDDRLTKLELMEQDLKEMYWFKVGDKAAELEPDRRLRAQAARDARERFERYVNSGKCLKDSYRRALETPPPR